MDINKKAEDNPRKDLFAGVKENDLQAISLLIENDLACLFYKEDFHGMTALHLAAYTNKPAIAELLIKKGACLISTDIFGCTPLHWACREGHYEIAEMLLKSGADVNAIQSVGFGKTSLIWAAEEGHEDIVYLLLKNGADPNIDIEYIKYFFTDKLPFKSAEILKHTVFSGAKTDVIKKIILRQSKVIKLKDFRKK